jgi:2,3-bisphosphoglycerate-dependent phosphoglycerate mutase
VAVEVVFETHSTSADNERGRATGWRPGRLSQRGRTQALDLGRRRRDDGIAAVFSSDPGRAVETATIAFGGSAVPVLQDRRLRECDYGQCTGMPASELAASRMDYLDVPYPGGESWRQAVTRVASFLGDLPLRWSGRRVLIIGHVATRWGLDHAIGGIPLEELAVAGFAWQEGWEYRLTERAAGAGIARRPPGLS